MSTSSTAVGLILCSALLAGCATPAQRLTRDAFDRCKGDTHAVWLEHVAADGEYWMRYRDLAESRAIEACMRSRSAVRPSVTY